MLALFSYWPAMYTLMYVAVYTNLSNNCMQCCWYRYILYCNNHLAILHSSHTRQDGYIRFWLTTPPLLRLGMEPSYCQSKSTGFWFSRNDLPECGGHSGTSFWYSTILLTTCITAHMYNVALTSLDIHLYIAS